MVFLSWKIASVRQSCCTSWEPVHVLIIHFSWKNMTKPYAPGFSKCVTWTWTIFRGLGWLCPLRWAVLGFHPHKLLALPAFQASAFGASDFLTTVFSQTVEDVSFTKALEKWLTLTNEQESPLNGTQKNWTQPVYVKTAQDLIFKMDDKRSKVFNAHQGKFGSQWLNVVPSKNLELDDQQLRISIVGLRLVANICVAHTCLCGKRVERDSLHGLSCTKSASRFSRHAILNSLIKQTLGSFDLPSVLEPRGLYQTDGKRPDEVTMIPWEMGKQLVWDVTVVDALALSCLSLGSVYNPGTSATEAKARKIEKYRELIDNGNIFQPMALEVQGSLGESSEIFIMRFCKMLCRSHDDQRTSWQLFEATDYNGSLDWHCGLCVRNCERQRCVRRNLLPFPTFFNLHVIAPLKENFTGGLR